MPTHQKLASNSVRSLEKQKNDDNDDIMQDNTITEFLNSSKFNEATSSIFDEDVPRKKNEKSIKTRNSKWNMP